MTQVFTGLEEAYGQSLLGFNGKRPRRTGSGRALRPRRTGSRGVQAEEDGFSSYERVQYTLGGALPSANVGWPLHDLSAYALVAAVPRHHDTMFSWSGVTELPASIPHSTPYTALSIVPVLLIHAVKTTNFCFLGNLPPFGQNAQGLASHKDGKNPRKTTLWRARRMMICLKTDCLRKRRPFTDRGVRSDVAIEAW